jgi:ADP-ribose pyrophosphatase
MSAVDAPWQVLDRETLLVRPRLTVVRETVELPDGRVIRDYDQIQMGRAAVIVPEQPDGRVLVFKTYKHGARRAGLGFPGGGVEPGESDQAAAERELREETGLAAQQWRPLGTYAVHSNQGCGTVVFFAASGCRPVATPTADDLEAHEVLYLTADDIRRAIADQAFLSMGHVCLAGIWLATRAAHTPPSPPC